MRDGLCRLHHEACSSTARRGAARAQTPCALSLETKLSELAGRAAAELARAQAASGTGRRRAAATAERSSEKDHPAPPCPPARPLSAPCFTPRRETGDGRRAAADGAEPQTAPAGRQLGRRQRRGPERKTRAPRPAPPRSTPPCPTHHRTALRKRAAPRDRGAARAGGAQAGGARAGAA